ncbi:hypothetical protein JCGZ_08411 [Jatropha curcas]|uniref:Uncharacterized protein n=1 Tax=Jatropha curcas TaxID=180498 RepID=A0A067KYQ9_JATCU|nr:hypothetical protein JCGZ_08411 [Jatropha curcas]
MSYETGVTIVVHHRGVFTVRKGKVSYDGGDLQFLPTIENAKNEGNHVQTEDGGDNVSYEDGGQTNENGIGSNNETIAKSNNTNSSATPEVGASRSTISIKTEDGEYEEIEVDPDYQFGNEELHRAREQVKIFFTNRGSADDEDSIGDEGESEE